MVNYQKILVMEFDGISQRTISSSTGHSRNTIAEVVQRAKESGLKDLEDAMNNQWLATYLFPEKQAIENGYCPVDFEWVHKELQKKMSP
jgi:transposase